MKVRKLNPIIKKEPFVLNFAKPQENIEFTNFNSFKQFVESEYEFWKECTVGECTHIYNQYNNLYQSLISYEQQIISNPNLNEEWLYNALVQQINAFNGRFNYNFYSKQVYSVKIKELHRINYLKSDGFIKYMQGVNFDANNPVIFSGAIEAYTLENTNESMDEVISASRSILRNTIDEYVAEANKLHTEFDEKLSKIDDEYEILTNETGLWKKTTEEELSLNIESLKTEVNDYISNKKTRMEELENLYNEKLKLESPAKYWSELESKYRTEGFWWLVATVVASILLIGLLVSILYNIPSSLNIKYIDFTFESLRSTLILMVIISVGIYLLRLFVKMAISAYHLSRDAKERYQLSYFYLSLINDKAISETDRSVVLQSLFSRVDTGLLKGDSSPAFPVDGMVNQILKNVK